MAQAVMKLRPGTQLGFGPPVRDGFYYDFVLPEPITDADLPAIEAEMRRIISEGQPFVREDLPAGEGIRRASSTGQTFKAEYSQDLVEKQGHQSLSFYSNGTFSDLCEGPHVANTKDLPAKAFKLHSISGAYWRGDEHNPMMTRIYGYAFETPAELEAHLKAVELAKDRDHRKLGAQLGIYVIREEVGKGLPLWLPNGAAIRGELEKLAHEMEFKAGYVRVATPHITKGGLFETSGHIPLYLDGMFPPMKLVEDKQEGEEPTAYYLKPMNCPHHHMIFDSQPRSYRDLPLRLAEYGTVYRYERAGQLQGLTRVRGMAMNDAHIYVSAEQLKDEFKSVMELHKRYYDLFGFKDYYLRLSLWDPDDPKKASKYVDDPENWAHTEKIVQEALEEMGLYYTLQKGEAAFYGPKVDFQFESVIGREFTCSTNQLDFAVPPRFKLHYTDRDGTLKTPYCIHRAPLGTHERFIAFLLEHYGGAFPAWLAPVQVRVIPISDKFLDYARKVRDLLRDTLIRAEVDESAESTNKKIRAGATAKIPILLVAGAREQEQGTVTVRRYGIEQQRSMDLAAFHEMVSAEIRNRRHVTAW